MAFSGIRCSLLLLLCWPVILYSQFNIRQIGERELPTVDRLYYLSQSQDGMYWIGGNQGIIQYDGKIAAALSIRDSSRLIETDQKLQSPIFEDKRGDLWFTTHSALIKYRRDYNSFHVKRVSIADQDATADYRLFHLDQEKDEAILQAGPHLWSYQLTTGNFTNLGGPARGVDYSINPAGTLIIGSTWTDELEIFRKKKSGAGFDRTSLKVPARVSVSQFHLNDTVAYLGTSLGLAELIILPDTTIFNLLSPSPWIRSLVIDQEEEAIWFTTHRQGIACFDLAKRTLKHRLGPTDGLGGASPSFIYLDQLRNIWLFYSDKGPEIISIASYFVQKVPTEFNNNLADLTITPQNVTYALTEEGELLQYAANDSTLANTWAAAPFYAAEGRVEKGKFCQYEDDLLIIANTHIAQKKPLQHTWSFFRKPRNTFNRSFPGKLQHPLFSTDKGMVTFSLTRDSVHQEDQIIFPTAETQQYPALFPLTDTSFIVIYKGAQLWTCAYQNGIYAIRSRIPIDFELRCATLSHDRATIYLGTSRGLFSLEGDQLTNLFTEEGTVKQLIIESITQDYQGGIWCGTQHGLLQFWPDTGEKVIYGERDGLPVRSFSNIQPIHQPDGRIWMAMQDQVISFLPAQEKQKIMAPAVPYLRGVWVNDLPLKDYALHEARTALNLPNIKNTLAFYLGCITADDDPNIEIEYQLLTYDQNPVRVSRNSTIRYPNLPPGNYTLRLTAINRNGLPSREKRLSITIQPPFWKTLPFYLLCTCALALLIAGIYVAGLRRERLKQQRLREQQERIARERDRIAGEVHDDLGGQISSILYLSEEMLLTGSAPDNEHELNRINELSRNSLQNVRDIIFALDNRRATLSALGEQLRGAGSVFFADRKIDFSCTDQFTDPGFNLTSRQKRNLTLIIKEAWHNTAKHAAATAVTLDMQQRNGALHLIFTDNGRGFVSKQSNKTTGGYGLENMEEKAHTIGATLTIDSQPGTGTTLTLNWPLPKTDA